MSVYDITLTDPTENVRPPEKVLHITAVNELVFVAVRKYDETHDSQTLDTVADIAVSLPALREALDLLSRDGQREGMRERDSNGPTARIGGARATVVPL